VRPRPGARLEDAGFRVALKSGLNPDQTALLAAVEEDIGYGSSEPIRIPAEMVEWVNIQGPALFDGQRLPPGDVEIRLMAARPQAGQMIELRLHGIEGADGTGGETYSYEGEVRHFDIGELGSSLDVAFCGGELVVKYRFPHVAGGAVSGEVDANGEEVSARLAYSIRNARPAVVAELLGVARHIRSASILELYVGDVRIAKMGGKGPISPEDYGIDKLVIEQFAYDLDIVQRHCKKYFSMPKEVSSRDQIDVCVARILLEGGVVASPVARIFTLKMTGECSPTVRNALENPWMLAMRSAEPYVVTIDGKTLSIGQVWVTHPKATAINGDDAIKALDAGTAEDFAVDFRPGDDQFFLLALADKPFENYIGEQLSLWSLVDVEQPDTDRMLNGWD